MTAFEATLPSVAPMVKHGCLLLRERMSGAAGLQGVVVGCGNGDEVVYMERALSCRRVVGVDVGWRFTPLARASGRVFLGDGERLPFPSATFDFAAAYHSLEHVHDPRRALEEIHRVLRPGGWFYLGVPNRTRVIGYLGSFDMTLWQKIRGNLIAWNAQLRGKFRNELGVHAGFDRHELARMLDRQFTGVQIVTTDYVRFKYTGRIPGPILNALLAPSVFDYSVAAHYAICQKSS